MLGSVEEDNKQGFPYWEDGGESPHQPKIYSFPLPHLEKSPQQTLHPIKFLFPSTKSQSPLTKQQFSSYNPIKTTFLAVAIASAPFCFNFILFGHTGHVNFYFDVQYSQEDVFSFKKGSNRQNHSSSGSLHPVKKFSPPSKISESPLHALPLFGKP